MKLKTDGGVGASQKEGKSRHSRATKAGAHERSQQG